MKELRVRDLRAWRSPWISGPIDLKSATIHCSALRCYRSRRLQHGFVAAALMVAGPSFRAP